MPSGSESYVYISPNNTNHYNQNNVHFATSTLYCKASYGPTASNHVYYDNGVEQVECLPNEGGVVTGTECSITLTRNVNVTISGSVQNGATITITELNY